MELGEGCSHALGDAYLMMPASTLITVREVACERARIISDVEAAGGRRRLAAVMLKHEPSSNSRLALIMERGDSTVAAALELVQ